MKSRTGCAARSFSGPGHTPGQVALNVERGGARAILCGDLFHHALQVAEPSLNSTYCVDPKLSAATRTAFVERHADSDTLIIPAHLPGETAGRIPDAGGARPIRRRTRIGRRAEAITFS